MGIAQRRLLWDSALQHLHVLPSVLGLSHLLMPSSLTAGMVTDVSCTAQLHGVFSFFTRAINVTPWHTSPSINMRTTAAAHTIPTKACMRCAIHAFRGKNSIVHLTSRKPAALQCAKDDAQHSKTDFDPLNVLQPPTPPDTDAADAPTTDDTKYSVPVRYACAVHVRITAHPPPTPLSTHQQGGACSTGILPQRHLPPHARTLSLRPLMLQLLHTSIQGIRAVEGRRAHGMAAEQVSPLGGPRMELRPTSVAPSRA